MKISRSPDAPCCAIENCDRIPMFKVLEQGASPEMFVLSCHGHLGDLITEKVCLVWDPWQEDDNA